MIKICWPVSEKTASRGALEWFQDRKVAVRTQGDCYVAYTNSGQVAADFADKWLRLLWEDGLTATVTRGVPREEARPSHAEDRVSYEPDFVAVRSGNWFDPTIWKRPCYGREVRGPTATYGTVRQAMNPLPGPEHVVCVNGHQVRIQGRLGAWGLQLPACLQWLVRRWVRVKQLQNRHGGSFLLHGVVGIEGDIISAHARDVPVRCDGATALTLYGNVTGYRAPLEDEVLPA